MDSFELAKKCEEILENKKGIDIKVIKSDVNNVLTDYIVIATGTSTTHLKALADEVETKLKEIDIFPHHIEGYHADTWILLDYIGVVVHIFLEQSRKFYNIYGEATEK